MSAADTILRGLPWLVGGCLLLGWSLLTMDWMSRLLSGDRVVLWRHLLAISYIVLAILAVSYGIGTTVQA
jgi:hypothetical protein